MIKAEGVLTGKVSSKQGIKGQFNSALFHELEDLEVMPSTEEQNFKSSKYGYDNVKVAGSENLLAENIKKDVDIFGVVGTGNMTNAKITNAAYLFYENSRIDKAQELLDLCENITDAKYMCYNATQLTELDLSKLDTSNVTNMSYMFNNCFKLTKLDLSNLNTSNVTNMSYMFSGCTNITELNIANWDTSKLTTACQMFYNLSKITELDLSKFDTSNLEDASYMFGGLSKLTSLDLSNFDFSKVTNISSIFNSWYYTEFRSFKNLGKGYTQKTENYFRYELAMTNSKITHDMLMDVIINGLYDLNLTYDVANGGTLYRQTFKIGSTNKAKLTAEEIAIAENKGWNVT